MIILDTNVLSEPLRPRPAPQVVRWLDAQAVETLWITSLTLVEIGSGIAVLPEGERRSTMAQRFADEVVTLFAGRVLSFDARAADVSGPLRARARAAGTPLGLIDALIASIAAAHGFAVATRDTAPFLAAGVEVLDPFDAP